MMRSIFLCMYDLFKFSKISQSLFVCSQLGLCFAFPLGKWWVCPNIALFERVCYVAHLFIFISLHETCLKFCPRFVVLAVQRYIFILISFTPFYVLFDVDRYAFGTLYLKFSILFTYLLSVFALPIMTTCWLISRQSTILSFIQLSMANVRNNSAIATEQSRSQPQVLSTDTFTCPLCSVILSSRSHLLHHVGTEHRESFFAICKTCMQCFTPKEIDGHVSACKGPFVCPYCRQTFALLSYLNRHVRRKHSIDDENRAPSVVGGTSRYACKFCSKTYSTNSSLNCHIRKHLNCVCNVCGSRLVRESGKGFAICGACGNQMSFTSSKQLASFRLDII